MGGGHNPIYLSISLRYKRDTGKMSIEELAEMDDYDCGKQYLCELSAMQAGQHNIQDPLLISLLQVSDSLLLFSLSLFQLLR